MEEVLIDDNMVFDIDNLKGFLNDTSSFGFIAKENNKIIGFAYCYTLLRPDGKTMFYLHSIGMLPNYQDNVLVSLYHYSSTQNKVFYCNSAYNKPYNSFRMGQTCLYQFFLLTFS